MKKNKRTALHNKKGTIKNIYLLLCHDALTRIHDIQLKMVTNPESLHITKENVTLVFTQTKEELAENLVRFKELIVRDNSHKTVYSEGDCPTYLTGVMSKIATKYFYSYPHLLIENTVLAQKQVFNYDNMPNTERIDKSADLFKYLSDSEQYDFKFSGYEGEIASKDNKSCRITIEVMKDLSIQVRYADNMKEPQQEGGNYAGRKFINFVYTISHEVSKSLPLTKEFAEKLLQVIVGYMGDSTDLHNKNNLIDAILYIFSRMETTASRTDINNYIGKKIEEAIYTSHIGNDLEVYATRKGNHQIAVTLGEAEIALDNHKKITVTYELLDTATVYESEFTTRSEWKAVMNKLMLNLVAA